MARSSSNTTKVRLTLALSASAKAKLDRLQKLADADSMSETIRRALAVYEVVLAHQRQGGHVVLEKDDGDKPERLVVV
ncbi:MAG: ribbon-helix-helix protein, CopG family [Polyangiaceae bacterium]